MAWAHALPERAAPTIYQQQAQPYQNKSAASFALALAANVNGMKLEAFKYYYAPAGAVGVAGICARPTLELLKFQADLILAVAPYTVEPAPSARSPHRRMIPPQTPHSSNTFQPLCPRCPARTKTRTSVLALPRKTTLTKCWPNRLTIQKQSWLSLLSSASYTVIQN
jgi:hypothetical protein